MLSGERRRMKGKKKGKGSNIIYICLQIYRTIFFLKLKFKN